MLWSAALVIALTGIAHSWLGERMLIGPLLAPENKTVPILQRQFPRMLLRFAWHITTITWFGISAMLIALATEPLGATGRTAVLAIAAAFLVMGVMSLIAGRGRHPSWAVFLIASGLCFAAAFAG